MCLVSTRLLPLITREDVVCYKVIEILPQNQELWTGVFNSENNFPFGKVYAKGEKVITDHYYDVNYSIGKGFFHAYLNKIDTIPLFYAAKGNGEDAIIKIVTCIIPKGNKYYISIDKKEICSPSMIIYDRLLDSYDKDEKVRESAITIYFKTILNKISNYFKRNNE